MLSIFILNEISYNGNLIGIFYNGGNLLNYLRGLLELAVLGILNNSLVQLYVQSRSLNS